MFLSSLVVMIITLHSQFFFRPSNGSMTWTRNGDLAWASRFWDLWYNTCHWNNCLPGRSNFKKCPSNSLNIQNWDRLLTDYILTLIYEYSDQIFSSYLSKRTIKGYFTIMTQQISLIWNDYLYAQISFLIYIFVYIDMKLELSLSNWPCI